jgi:hypothetical protein
MNLEKIMEEKNAVLDAVTKKCQKLEAENKRLLKLFDFILNECDWEENRGNKGDNRIGKACRKAQEAVDDSV